MPHQGFLHTLNKLVFILACLDYTILSGGFNRINHIKGNCLFILGQFLNGVKKLFLLVLM